jgi:FkbM family methyltransferase
MISAHLVNGLTNFSVVRRVLKWYAGRYEEGSVVRIAAGYAGGMKWRRYHRHVNGYWTGVYEPDMQRVLAGALCPGMVFYDIGANAGFFSIVAAKLVREAGRVFAFEPLPENAESVRAQIEVNTLENCELIDKAVCDRSGTSYFAYDENNSQSKLAPDGIDRFRGEPTQLTVETITLDEFAMSHPAPDVIKIDVEGAEVEVLAGASDILNSDRPPVLILELHGEQKGIAVHRVLTSTGYEIADLAGRRLQDGRHGCTHVLAKPRRRL